MEKNIYTLIYLSLLIFWIFTFIKYQLYELNHKSLFQQPLFWAAIVLPLITCIYFGLFVWIDKIKSFNLTSHGYERFLDISKLPLLILASSVPLVSIVNNLHRTKQTEKQILEAERKNRVDLYYNHLKFHLDLFKKIEGKRITSYYPYHDTQEKAIYKFYIKHPQQLYRNAYPRSTPDDSQQLDIDDIFIQKLHKLWCEINARLKQLSESYIEIEPSSELCTSKMRIFFGIMSAYEKTCKHLCLGGYHDKNSFILNDIYDNYQIFSPFYDFHTMYESLQSLEEVTYAFLDTCRNVNVNLYFPLDDKILIYGEGILQSWFHYSTFLIPTAYQPAKISRLPTLEL